MKYRNACFALAVIFCVSSVYGQVTGSEAETLPTASGPTTFTGSNATQIVHVIQTGTGSGLSATTSSGGDGVDGYANAASGSGNGVYGQTDSASGIGVLGINNSSGSLAIGVQGIASASGTSAANWGVKGFSQSANGVGVEGFATAVGVRGQGLSCGSSGCTPEPADAGQFITGSGGNILHGFVNNAGTWTEMFRVDSGGDGFFAGNLNVTGTLTKGSGSFKIDHPLDPANKYLSHSFVESPDMMNVYNGNITTNRRGLAIITLPSYFGALNRDFRYQLTVIGQFAQAIVESKITNNRFVIRTSRPNVEVSWQVTGIRQDAYANANRIPVEEDKPAAEQGYYLHPEVFGQPESKSISAAQKTVRHQDILAQGSPH